MYKKFQTIFVAAVVSTGLGVLTLTPVSAACTSASSCVTDGLKSTGGSASKTDLKTIIANVVKVLMFLIGAVSVIMIIIGGIRYTISQGDSSAITSAKNTILYAVIGLAVAIFAYAIVDFIVKQFA